MRPARSIEAFAHDPVGHYVSGATFLFWCAHRSLFGLTVWGRPALDDVARIMSAHRAELARGPRLHASVVDARRLEAVEPMVFGALVAHLDAHRDLIAEQVRAQALIRSNGLAGAMIAGLPELAAPPCPTRVFTDPGDALRWLGFADCERLFAALGALVDELSGKPPTARALRAVLDADPHVDLDGAARRLGMSTRSLQRRLNREATSFQGELDAARVRTAKALLQSTDRRLGTIARQVGCSSLAHFSTLFRRVTGETASAWRERRRSKPAPPMLTA